VLYTDVGRDGTQRGANVEATAALSAHTSVPIIASGGVGSLDDLRALAARGIAACVVGRALYERSFSLEEAVRAASFAA
jgi:phosphoribosylformimino-5-aminoimidazole carboxamide ribotide isomerase